MTGSPADGSRTEQWFEDRLRTLVQEAIDRDVDIVRHWVCRTEQDGVDYEVGIARLADRTDET